MKGKPKWVITDLPFDVKVKLWRAMQNGPTYQKIQSYIANNPDMFSKSEYAILGVHSKALANLDRNTLVKKDNKAREWTLFSRETYKALLQEIRIMPLREIARLPEDIQNWARGIKGDELLSEDIKSILDNQKEHQNDLAKAAIRLAENLAPYLLKDEGYLEDYIIGTKLEEDKDLEEQLIADIPTRWLLKHLAEDFPFLKKVKTWGGVPTKNITDKLLKTMRDKAAQKNFPGKCEICENDL